jgi:hypothetical protein
VVEWRLAEEPGSKRSKTMPVTLNTDPIWAALVMNPVQSVFTLLSLAVTIPAAVKVKKK